MNDIPLASSFPRRITLEASSRCQLSCCFCPRHIGELPLGDMSWELFQKIVDEAASYLPVTLTLFFRGEPLLNPRLTAMIRYAKQKGLGPVQLASNGLGLNENLADEIVESGLDFISFSLDTLDSELYRTARQGGDLKKSMANVLNFCQRASQRRERGLAAPQIQVSSVDIEKYRFGQSDFINFWCQWADRVRLYVEHSSDGHPGSIDGELVKKIDCRQPCHKVFTDMVIYWDGQAALCNHDWCNQLTLGSAANSSLAEIWGSELYREIRRSHEQGRPLEGSVCVHCDHWQIHYLPEGFMGRLYTRQEK